jgi:hypothetical protein
MAEMAAGTVIATVLLSRLWPISSVRGGLGAAAITLLAAGVLALGWARWQAAWPRAESRR